MGIAKEIVVRRLTDDDMVEVSEWYVKRKWPVAPGGGMLPESGYIAELNGEKLAAGWLYVTNSTIGIIDWLATSPSAGVRGLIGIRRILRHIEDVTQGSEGVPGHHTLMTFTPNVKFAKFLKEKCGYKTAERGLHLCVRNRRQKGKKRG